MQLSVHGVHVDIGAAYQARVAQALDQLANKYKIEMIAASAQLSKHNTGFVTEISAHIGRGVFLRGADDAEDAFMSVDAAARKLDTKLRKHKKRLADHHRQRDIHFESTAATSRIIEAQEANEVDTPISEHTAPIIVAETEETVPVLSVSDAVFYFDLSDRKAMMFKNAGSGEINMIYQRADGNLGWVEPKNVR